MNIKKVIIDDKEVGLRVDGFSPILYKMNFKSDLFADFVQSLGGVGNLEKNLDEINAVEMLDNIDTTFYYKLLWLNAKSYDKSIPEFEAWLSSFNYINIYDLFEVLIELNFANLVGTKKKITKDVGNNNNEDISKNNDPMDTETYLALCKLNGFSFNDMKELTVGFLIDVIDEMFNIKYPKEDDKKETNIIQASQEHFDNF